MKMNFGILVLSVLALAASGCTKNGNGDLNPLLRLSKNIQSTRAKNSTHFIAIVKLKNPALLESAKFTDGKTELNAELLKEITSEQNAAVAALKALSPEVQIIYQYKMVLNAVAVLAPIELSDKIKGLGLVAYSESSGSFERPKTFELSNSIAAPAFMERNSSKFIGAEKLNQSGIAGKGVKVGIIDTGVDYTHAMFFGEGTEEAYKAVNPDAATPAFPNKKIVGGIDLVGTVYDAASLNFANHIPKPDMNPMDEGGHGSHVAGTVAGHGDGVNTYNGMAPDADLHAIKVFGADGSTSDFVVIAALEYSADPNADGNNDDVLDVVNLSLGSGYGNPHILYTEAIRNLVKGGTVVVASAGNSGHQDYIVGAPGTADAALSVAASIDNGDHLWKFNASRINLGSETLMVEAVEAATSKRIAEAGDVSGKLVYAGLATEDLTPELAAAVKGNIALIDRGVVPFNDKVKRAAAAGAIGVVVANNREGSALAMGTTDKFDIPAIMITLPDAKKTKAAMEVGAVTLDFKTDVKIEKPELIDTLTDFTSKGPRSIDGMIKPEISAPGENVISAAMGGGAKAVQMSGTSMAAPHMAGVMALLRQAQPKLSAAELKSLAMGRSKTMDVKGEAYSVSLQGAGRVQADVAASSPVVAAEASISLGEINVETKKKVRREINLRNLTAEKIELIPSFIGNGFISMQALSVVIEAGGVATMAVNLTLDATAMGDDSIREMDGWLLLLLAGKEVYRLPVLAIAHKLSQVEAGALLVSSASDADADGASAVFKIRNAGQNKGEALLFNLIGQDERKPFAESFMNSDCDLQSAGYRLNGEVLQVAIKLWKPMTTWHSCDVSIMIDSNGDGVAEQELLGSSLKSIPGQTSEEFATTLLDAVKARAIRLEFEKAIFDAKNDPEKMAELKQAEDYSEALLDQRGLKVYNNSSVMVLEIPVAKLALTRDGALAFKVIVTHNEQGSVENDDLLSSNMTADSRISLRKEDQSFLNLGDIKAAGGSEQKIFLTKGEGKEKLLVLFPENKFSLSNLHEDSQSQILSPIYLAP